MHEAFGIINASRRHAYVEGLQDYRPIGGISFLGRYRVVDFPISNLSNSGIDRIQLYINSNPRSLMEHLGTGRHYNINSKTGKLQILFASNTNKTDIYNTDITYYAENMESIATMKHEYVVITPSYMVYTADFSQLLEAHKESGADITLLYHTSDHAKEDYLDCDTVSLNRQKGVEGITQNHGNEECKHIFMDSYIMKKELLIDLVKKAQATSSMYTLADIVNDKCGELDVRGVEHEGYFAAITSFDAYVKANKYLTNYNAALELFHEDWPIYTRTNDSSPTHYYESAEIKNSVISNGCKIEGTVINSIVGRGCTIEKGAVIKDSIVFAGVEIGKNVHVENMVVDKFARIIHKKEVTAPADKPGYVERRDTL